MAQRMCARCNLAKDPGDFHKRAKRPDGLHPWCKSCCRDYNREYLLRPEAREQRLAWRRANETYDREARVLYLYGISAEQYDALLRDQNDSCGICEATEPGGRWNTWHVDHDHTHCPGKRGCEVCVRGLLCNGCNLAIGYLRDDPKIIAAAAAYVQRTRQMPLFT